MAIGDIYRVSIVGDYGAGLLAVYTLHFKMLSGIASVTSLAAALKNNPIENWKQYQVSTFNTRSINFNSVNVTPPVSVTYTTGFPVAGTGSGNAIPFTNAFLISIRTGYAGRSYRGRIYIPGHLEIQSDGSTVHSDIITAANTYWGAVVTTYGASGTDGDWQWVVYSHKLSQSFPVVSILPRNVWATQRRRRPGVGA